MTSPSKAPLSDLMDSFAMAAIKKLIVLYTPKIETADGVIQWCNQIAEMSYAMARTMMNTRLELHAGIIENTEKEEENAA